MTHSIAELEKLLKGCTPGPWEANNYRILAIRRDAIGEPIYESVRYICDTATNKATRTQENRDNAQVIAAAPSLAAELLAIKQAAAEYMREIDAPIRDLTLVRLRRDQLRNLVAAPPSSETKEK